ncbi:hypothetical protein JCM11251_002016 [Rhodosporidiobolus azoricus]
MRTRSSLFALAIAFTAIECAAAAPAAANGCYAETYATCSSARITGATSCVDGYYVASGRCKPLAEGQFKGADGKPTSCAVNVKTCTATSILTCKTGFFLLKDKTACVSSCPDSFYPSRDTCASCYSAAVKSCTDAKIFGATACMPGYGLSGGRCMPATKLPAGSYISSTGQVKKCGENAKTCNDAGALTCISPYLLTATGECSAACPVSTFADATIPAGKYGGADGKLHSCPSGQATCTEAGPTTCATGYSLSADKTECEAKPSCPAHAVCENAMVKSCTDNWLLYNGACVQSCPLNTFSFVERGACYDTCPSDSWFYDVNRCGDPTKCPQRFYDNAWKCFSCGKNALTCDEYHAITCKSEEYTTIRDELGYPRDCGFIGCPSGQHTKDWDETCSPCPDANVELCMPISGEIVQCKVDYSLSYESNKCIPADECPAGTGAYEVQGGGLVCTNCPWTNEGVLRCNTSGATKCASGYTLTPDFNNERHGLTTCLAEPTCPENAICDASDKVVSCKNDYLLYNGHCVDHCPSGVFNYAQKQACFDECPARSWHYDMSTCYGTCPQQWIDNQYTCTECGLNAATCDQNRAITCVDEQYIPFADRNGGYHNCAFINCPEGAYAPEFDDVCVPCPGENMAMCYPITGQHIRCKDGFAFASNGQNGGGYGDCVDLEACPRGTYPADTPSNGRMCQQCPYSWSGVTACDVQGVATDCTEGLALDRDDQYNGDLRCFDER